MTTAAKVGTGLGVLGLIAVAFIPDEPVPSSQSQSAAPVLIEQGLSAPVQNPVTPKVLDTQKAQTAPRAVQAESSCHPSYSGCLKANASDYDCAGGSGNGPYYTGTVRVIGPDVFGLDRDGDGWGCD